MPSSPKFCYAFRYVWVVEILRCIKAESIAKADCHIAYGGALTFKNAGAAREGARLVPLERLMLETDSPYMTPEPMRGAACTPAHVIFTAAVLAETRGVEPGDERRAFLQQLHENTLRFFASQR